MALVLWNWTTFRKDIACQFRWVGNCNHATESQKFYLNLVSARRSAVRHVPVVAINTTTFKECILGSIVLIAISFLRWQYWHALTRNVSCLSSSCQELMANDVCPFSLIVFHRISVTNHSQKRASVLQKRLIYPRLILTSSCGTLPTEPLRTNRSLEHSNVCKGVPITVAWILGSTLYSEDTTNQYCRSEAANGDWTSFAPLMRGVACLHKQQNITCVAVYRLL